MPLDRAAGQKGGSAATVMSWQQGNASGWSLNMTFSLGRLRDELLASTCGSITTPACGAPQAGWSTRTMAMVAKAMIQTDKILMAKEPVNARMNRWGSQAFSM